MPCSMNGMKRTPRRADISPEFKSGAINASQRALNLSLGPGKYDWKKVYGRQTRLFDVAPLRARHVKAEVPRDGKDVLVAPPAHVHADDVILRQLRRDLHHMCQRVGRLKSRNDPFQLTTFLERGQRFDVGDGDVLRTANLEQPGVLRPDARLVETC